MRYALTPGTRRSIPALTACCVLLTACSILPAVYHLWAAGGRYEVREVKPGVFVWIPEDIIDQDGDARFNRAGNVAFIITSEGVLVVNTTNTPFHAREVLYEIRRRTELPVKYVVNTGPEADQMLGNEVFFDLRATIISTPAAQAEVRAYRRDLERDLEGDDLKLQARMRGIHPTPSTQTFDRETALRLGDKNVRLVVFASTACAGDAAVYLPASKVLFLGDLYANAYFPSIGSRPLGGWIETLRQVEAWDAEVFVPGHGLPSTKKEVADFRLFLEWLRGEVKTRVQEGKTLQQVKGELLPLASYHWQAPEVGPRAVEAVYQQLTAESPKPAPSTHSPEH